MNKEELIHKTIQALQALPDDKAQEVSDFAEFILKKYEDLTLQQGIQKLQSQGETFAFLNQEEDIYSSADIKQKF